MPAKDYNFSIIFEELERLSKSDENDIAYDNADEYNEINELRNIVQEIQTPYKRYTVST